MTKILLVEDDKSLREIYGVRLLAEGYDIVSAGDGEEALAMAIKERPELIVSDVMMPKISGFDMLDILRSTTETRTIKVIMMTALSSEDQRARGEALGADRYLVKSQVGIEDVVRTVHDVLGDAPVATPSAAQTFGTPAPSALPRSTAPAVPPRQPAPTYQTPPAAPQYATPTASFSNPVAQPVTQTAPAVVPAPGPTGLPQPTAPFSTPRPANLGDRIIHPVASTALPGPDLGSLIDQELNRAQAPVAGPAPVAPPRPIPAPAPLQQPAIFAPQPQPQPQQPPVFTQPPVPAAPATPPLPTEMHGATVINFDEPNGQTTPSAPQPGYPFNPADPAPRA
jgi:CheY-like chemotaxis protein